MQNAVISAPKTRVSPQRTSSLANALITIASGPATTRPSGRTASPNATTAPSTNSGPRIDQRSSARPAFQHRVEHEQRAEQAEQHRQAPRQHARAHAAEGADRQIGALPEGEDRDGDDEQPADKILSQQQRCLQRDDGELSALTTFPLERVFVPVNGRPLSIIAFNAFGREPFPPLEQIRTGLSPKKRFGLEFDRMKAY